MRKTIRVWCFILLDMFTRSQEVDKNFKSPLSWINGKD